MNAKFVSISVDTDTHVVTIHFVNVETNEFFNVVLNSENAEKVETSLSLLVF